MVTAVHWRMGRTAWRDLGTNVVAVQTAVVVLVVIPPALPSAAGRSPGNDMETRMLTEYTTDVTARCPVHSGVDFYTVTIRADRKILCEDIVAYLATLAGKKVFQEDLTEKVARKFQAECETVGWHGRVKARCVVKPA